MQILELETATHKVLLDSRSVFQNQDDILKKIKSFKSPNVKSRGPNRDDYQSEEEEDDFHSAFDDINKDGMPKVLRTITIGIRKDIADDKFKVISDRVCLVDMPGVDDAVYS